MPEGDTLARIAAGLRPVLVGQTVIAARARAPGPDVGRLIGQPIRAVRSVGKNLLIDFANGLELRTHLRLHGSWHRYRPGEPWRRPASRAVLVLETPSAVAVCFDAPVVELLEARAARLHPPLGQLGPDLLDPDFDRDEALRRLRAPDRVQLEIGPALLDQTALAGIGNVYKSEVLFLEGVDPFVPVASLDDAILASLVDRARELLLANASRRRGPERITTRDAERRRALAPGPVWVYRRSGRPCRRCGSRIRSALQGLDLPRTTYWCPRCQAPPSPPGVIP